MAESANNSTLTPAFITDSTGGLWGLSPSKSSGAQVWHNGSVQTYTSNVALLLYFNHSVYQQTSGKWYVFKGHSWTPSSDPRITPLTESPSGTSVTTAGPAIIDSTLESWTLVNSGGASGMQIAVNTQVDTATAIVTLLYYANHLVYQQNANGGWWYKSKSSDAWTATTDPRIVPTISKISLSNTSVAPGAASGTVVGTITVALSSGTFSGTLTLSGTNAASFQIIGNNLVTNGTISAGNYSVSVTATQPGMAAASQAFSITAANPNTGVTAPTQAANAGYHNLVFNDDFTTNTIATTQGASSGYNWYWNFCVPNPIPANSWTVNTGATAASINNGNSGGGSNASPAGGILQINTGSFGNGTNNGNIISIPGYALNTSGAVLPPLGTGHWTHFYIEAYIQFKINGALSSSDTNGWPAFWAWTAESIGNYGFGSSSLVVQDMTEIDFLETFDTIFGNTPGVWQSTMYNHGTGAQTQPVPNATTDDNWHTYGMLWTPGTVSIYYDNVLAGSSSDSFTQLETNQSLFIILGTGNNWQMNVDWVRVWQ